MEILAEVNFFMFIIVSSVGMYFGMDLKKWSSWFIFIYGFLSGFLIIFVNIADIALSIEVGIIIALAIMYTGVIIHRRRQNK